MNTAKFASRLPLIFLLAGCDLGSGRYPPASPYMGMTSAVPSSSSQPALPQGLTGSQRGLYAWEKALEGMVIGGSIGGLYGAGGGLVIGLLAGLFTAESHYAQVNNQIQTEVTKDKVLEAKIEEELERQRQLEAQIANNAESPTRPNDTGPPASAVKPTGATVSSVAMKEGSSTVASLSKTEIPSNAPTRPFKNVEVRDLNGDGVPDLWIYYSALKPTEIVRQEEASHFDGRVDVWSYFKDGKLVRREVDSQGKGAADTFYYYENEKIVREERDGNGTGDVSFRAIYQNGRRARVEEDTTGRRKMDHWIYYDTSKDGEIVVKEERDLNGDGTVDEWSYYEDGRLVRRDLSAVGLELLTKQDESPSSPVNPKQTSRPKVRKDKG
jgi:hypothetical protein